MPITNTLTVLGAILAQEEERKRQEMLQASTVAGKPPSAIPAPGPLAEMEARYGRGEVAGTSGTMRSYTDARGFTRTYSAGGSQFSLQIPTHYTNDYSPQDQKKIEKLYKDRSDIATDPELDRDEEARQAALDEIDRQISRVPRVTPIMKQPTPQEQFNSTIVTTPDGQQGYWDGKKFTAFSEGKGDQAYRDAYSKYLDAKMKAEADKEDPRPWDVLHREAKLQADLQFGRVAMPEPSQGLNPALNDEWTNSLANLKPKWHLGGRQANEKEMKAEMASYIQRAIKLGVSPEIAAADYLQRWKDAADGAAPGRDIVSKMSDAMKKEAQYAYLDTIQAGPEQSQGSPQGPDMFAAGPLGEVPRGGGIVSREGGTTTVTPAPKGLEAIWPGLDEEDRQAVTQAMQQGYTARQILDTYKKAVGAQ